ncbi:MAG: hypothetical protein NTV00_15345, partial [Methylococcales bacterium]|nr:hypothetical protein [Methylococcales bacterium]
MGSGTPTTSGDNTGTAHISYSDTDNSSEQRQYRIITAPAHGVILRDNAVISVNSVFTQEDLDTGKIQYRHDGSENFTDSIAYVVSDGDYTVGITTTAQGAAAPTPAIYHIEILPTNDAPTLSATQTIINLDNLSAPNPITGFSLNDADLASLAMGEIDFVQVTVRLLNGDGTAFTNLAAYAGFTLAATAGTGSTVDATNGYLVISGTQAAVNTSLATLTADVPADKDAVYKVQVIVDDRLRDGSGNANGGSTNQNPTAGGAPTAIDTTTPNWYSVNEASAVPVVLTPNLSASSVTLYASSVNDLAILTNTNAPTINEDVSTLINGFTVSDAESLAFALPVTVTLSVPDGSLGIAGSSAQTSTTVNGHSITIAGDNTGTLVLTGQAADIQTLLNDATNGLSYTSSLNGNHDYNGGAAGDVSLTVHLDDAGSRIGGDVGSGSVAA